MIQDVIKTDMAIHKPIALDTVVPLILYDGQGTDTFHWFGRVVETDMLSFSGLHRYMLIEYVGDLIVERTIFADGEFNVNDDWNKSNVSIFPIYARAFDLKQKESESRYERYMDGIEDVLQDLWAEDHCISIHERIKRRIEGWRNLPNIRQDRAYKDMVTGKILDNLHNYQITVEATDDCILPMEEAINEVVQDPNRIIHTKDVTGMTSCIYTGPGLKLKDIAKLKAKHCGLWQIGTLSGNPSRLFDPNDDDVTYGFVANENRWEQLALFDEILWNNLTDLYFSIDFNCEHDLVLHELDILNRYTGYHADKTEGMDEKRLTSILKGKMSRKYKDLHYVYELTYMISKLALYEYQSPLKHLKFMMNYWDEIYLEITTRDDKVHKVWYDSTLLTLADPSIMPLFY